MTFFGQSVHVMVKDVRQARWAFLGYAAVVAFATISALRVPQTDRQLFDLSMVVVVIAGMFVMAMLVQADSPVRSDSFWASRPIRPEAVLAAKGLSAAVLVGIPVAGVLAVLLANEVSAGTIAVLVARSASSYAPWLLIAMVIAAITRDLRTYTTTIVVLPVVIGVLLMIAGTSGVSGSLSTPPREGTTASMVSAAAIPIVGLGGALAILISLYRTRTLRRVTWASAIVVVPALLVTIFATPSLVASANEPTVAVAEKTTFVVEVRSTADVPTSVAIGTGDPKETDRLLVLDDAIVTLRLGDGSTIRLPYSSKAVLETARMPVNDVRWAGPPRSIPNGGFITLSLTRDQRDAVRTKGMTSASVEANVIAMEPSVAATLPLRAGTTHRAGGASVHIKSVRPRDDGVAVVVRTSIERTPLDRTSVAMMPWYSPTKFVLVNRARAEAVIPGHDRSGGSAQGLILPGVWRWVESTSIQRVVSFNRELPVDDEWLRNADLVVLDWKVTGRSRQTIDAQVR